MPVPMIAILTKLVFGRRRRADQSMALASQAPKRAERPAGAAGPGRPGYINLGQSGDVGDTHVEAMERHAHEVLDAAYEGGVRYFDAARSYGRAEAFLGSWLGRRGLSRDDVTVGSKWGYTYTAD